MIKEKIYHLIDVEKGNQKGDFFVSYFIFGLIILNVITLFLESYQNIFEAYKKVFWIIEVVSIIIFSIEYLLRIWTADMLHENLSPFKARLKYIFSFMGIVDLMAILPFYLPYIIKIDLRVIRVLRLFRLLRILKLSRHHRSLQIISTVVRKSKGDIFTTIFITAILLILSSTLMFHIENQAQPDQFTDIGQALWWATATLTTVGYGDIYPVTGLGKALSAVIALLGIGIVALPTGIISSAYIQEVQYRKEDQSCPHCGKTIK